jgi:hypothetical protein
LERDIEKLEEDDGASCSSRMLEMKWIWGNIWRRRSSVASARLWILRRKMNPRRKSGISDPDMGEVSSLRVEKKD